MNDFDGLLAADFGFKPQGKSAPMAASKGSPNITLTTSRSARNSSSVNLFGGSARFPSKSESLRADSSFNLDSMFHGSKSMNAPVYDKPVYDDDEGSGGAFDDLLGGFGKTERESKRPAPDINLSSEPTASSSKTTSSMTEDPFKVFESASAPMDSSSGQFMDPLDEISKFSSSRSTKNDSSVNSNGGVYDDIDPFGGLGKSVPPFSSERNDRKDGSPPRTNRSTSWTRDKERFEKSSMRSPERQSQNRIPVDRSQEFQQMPFDMPTYSSDYDKPAGQRASSPSHNNAGFGEANVHVDMSPKYEENFESNDDVWLTVSEIPLFTQPTTAPPPSRPPPPRPVSSPPSHFDEFGDFSMGRSHGNDEEHGNGFLNEELERNSAAAAMKEAMDKAEAKFRHAREVRERKARQAVERATREARERAAAEARLRAERAAVEKASAEARERAERAAAEARERTNSEAKEREARERAAAARAEAEARVRAERAAVERAAAEARERAAAAARTSQQKNENDLESFFGMGTRASSAPRPPRANSSDSLFDTQFQSDVTRKPTGASSTMKKASSSTNIVDDLSSIFGAAPSSSGEFQEVEGETEERRRARLERHQRTQERAAKALAEKNQRDLQTQREQAERHRIAETLDFEIKRWAAGKEGNLRALLSTLQYVLWPECGWQPVSLTDLITGASVKKVYRKATLCIHPDKVQQKGANLQQKYIAEKVFDLLKEAWNKFNSEELF
ncbi:auxilin-related protein 2-like [Senna tora]|uniref:Auxilin-related protein 2-like n=1 Tax=Senna tora TaxID=362788 RepID=A0A835CBR5_9FABA|nr:auxilin-related protein 2-like [Senna tora]